MNDSEGNERLQGNPGNIAVRSYGQAMEVDQEDKGLKANEFDKMAGKLLPILPDLETISETYFTWHVESWQGLGRKAYSPEFVNGNFNWRILVFPYGNYQSDQFSIYLECQPLDRSANWYCCAQFCIVMWNKNDPSVWTHHYATHRFIPEESDWGFSRFYDLRKLMMRFEDRNHSIIENDETSITVYLRIVKDSTGILWHSFINYNSRKETGYVGLKNQGATCYMNSLLQSLYFTNFFRLAVYMIPTEKDEPNDSIALALQRLFYLLQTSSEPVSTIELTRSFGWDTLDSFMQHDIQEFNRVLQDNLEGKMKNSEAENALSKLFVGKMKSYIKCVNVDYESSRSEDFWDIQLNVKGMRTLRESFRDYIQVETLDGDNKYFAEGYGLQDAKKGVIFQSFPPVLHLQLKRFEYDLQRDTMVKINDHHEFPLEIDLEEFLSDDANKSEPHIYKLHGVLVHSGDLHGGHYYALLKPEKKGHWYKFDDDRVTKATLKEVLDENFGGDISLTNNYIKNPYSRNSSLKRYTNAYMLIYFRENELDEILKPVVESDIPSHLRKRLESEKAALEARRKEREEMHLYLYVKIVTDEDFKAHQGFDLSNIEERDPPVCLFSTHKILKETLFINFKTQIAENHGIDSKNIKFWVMVNRQNKTIRPDTPVPENDPTLTLEMIRDKMLPRRGDLLLYMELFSVDSCDTLLESWNSLETLGNNTKILIFLKHFDIKKQLLHGVSHIYINKHDKIGTLVSIICSLMDWPSTTLIQLYEEIKPTMIEMMKLKQTFYQAEIQDGDIICFQKVISEEEVEEIISDGGYGSAIEYYDFMLNKITVSFKPRYLDQDVTEEFDLVLSRKTTYDVLSFKVGERLNVPSTHIRFTTINSSTQMPKFTVKRVPSLALQNILQPAYLQSPLNTLFYEVLEISLSELETKRTLKIGWLPDGITREELIEVLVPKTGTLKDVVQALIQKLNISSDLIDRFHIFGAHLNRVYKDFDLSYPIASLQDFLLLYAEMIPEDELNLEKDDQYVNVYHFQKEPARSHGIPFRFIIKPNEKFNETKARLLKRTGMKEKDMSKVKYAVIQQTSFAKPHYLEDDDIIYDILKNSDDLLGLDHLDKTVRTGRHCEKAIFIKG
ncbi:hypothetical protein T552_00966 [Pneumocystis carinii B80]|uniref:ubiquitinyl hydrolase 1 n=1 Tax=Pneumocystis carinii (strain B80) TaxID=1408658 RepID=A0A0W4ZN05_PNEC8|nr:hypothetical protein T552_00966 [Pneumocystis carinii B80]KTW29759.1 hypothetical protein T552_00966 [Pneumocystis carinii B80]